WLIGIPMLGGGDAFADPIAGAYTIWSTQVRYVGVGAMVVGGFSSLITVRSGIFSAVSELSDGLRKISKDAGDAQRDLPPIAILLLGLICTLLLAGVNYHFAGTIGMALLATVIMLVM